ncbi:hypothetical protein KSP39_PZI012263 [Platanthera zijinensis]|uniref:Uncharacterized protein n=1 Tax=Platanthera zijinensis TaxID=2320716 RepID=A0AAP0BFV8_9ASPA
MHARAPRACAPCARGADTRVLPAPAGSAPAKCVHVLPVRARSAGSTRTMRERWMRPPPPSDNLPGPLEPLGEHASHFLKIGDLGDGANSPPPPFGVTLTDARPSRHRRRSPSLPAQLRRTSPPSRTTRHRCSAQLHLRFLRLRRPSRPSPFWRWRRSDSPPERASDQPKISPGNIENISVG